MVDTQTWKNTHVGGICGEILEHLPRLTETRCLFRAGKNGLSWDRADNVDQFLEGGDQNFKELLVASKRIRNNLFMVRINSEYFLVVPT
jgi:hypothetical protein